MDRREKNALAYTMTRTKTRACFPILIKHKTPDL